MGEISFFTMDCLNNAIGISPQCSNVVYPLGYIDELDGISLKSLASVEGGKYLSAQNMVNQKLQIVGSKIKENLGRLLGDTVVEQAVATIIPIQFSEDIITGAYGTPGVRIEKRPTHLTKLYIPFFHFKSATEVTDLVVTISDGQQSVDFSVSAEANEEVSIQCNFSTDQLVVTITYSAADPSQTIEPYTGNIAPYNYFGCGDCHNCGGCSGEGNYYLKVNSIDFDGELASRYYGLRADVEIVCDTERMICFMMNKNPWLFKYGLGVEIAKESIATDRLNFFAINSKDWWREAMGSWQYEMDKLWNDNGPSILKQLQKHDSSCFTCTGRHVQYSIG